MADHARLEPAWPAGVLHRLQRGEGSRAEQRELVATLGDWLPTLGLSQAQWEGIILPWAASLFSGDIEQARGMSARAAMLFAAKALPDNPAEQVVCYTVRNGMIEPMRQMLDQCRRWS